VADACAAKSPAQEETTATGMASYARVTTTEALLQELPAKPSSGKVSAA
jgi:hypothetical protein